MPTTKPSKVGRSLLAKNEVEQHLAAANHHIECLNNIIEAGHVRRAQAATDALVKLVDAACRDIYYRWSDRDTRALVQHAARKRETFPYLVTVEPYKGVGTPDSEWVFDAMIADLKFAPQLIKNKGKRRDFERDEMFKWIRFFTKAVDGRFTTIPAAVLRKLNGKDRQNPGAWAKAFVSFMLSEPYCYMGGLKLVPGLSSFATVEAAQSEELMSTKILKRVYYRGDKNEEAFANAFRDIARRRFASMLDTGDL